MRNIIKTATERIGKFFNFVQRKEETTLFDLVQEMEKMLDDSESQPIKFEQVPGSQFEMAALAEGAKILAARAQTLFHEKINTFLYKSISIHYRLEAVNGGTDPLAVQPGTVNLLKGKAYQWKEHQELIENKKLTEIEIYQLQVASQYPEFVELIMVNEELMGKFFRWVIRDHNEARVFIEYPALCEKIIASNLSGRIGRMNGKDLKIQKITNKEGVVQKIVTLPFEGVDHNILDGGHEVAFRGNYRLTVNQIFKAFEEKNLQVGNLEYFALGISNWNCHQWGFWNADKNSFETIDLSHRQWWHQLPIFEVVSREEAQKRYKQSLQDKVWCLAASATRGSATLDFENTHAFLEVAIPYGDDQYAIYDFGKFAKKYPATFFEGISIFCHNLHATVAYPDENIFYTHRQQTYRAFLVDEVKGKAILEQIKTDFFKGMDGNFVYQIESDNCAKWVHDHLESVLGKDQVPDMFRMHLLDTEPVGPVAAIFRGMKKLPKGLQTPVLTFCHLFLGASKKTWIFEGGIFVCKSLTRHDFWKSGVVYLPALLHKKIETNAFAPLAEIVENATQIFQAYVKAIYDFIDTVRDSKIDLFRKCNYLPLPMPALSRSNFISASAIPAIFPGRRHHSVVSLASA